MTTIDWGFTQAIGIWTVGLIFSAISMLILYFTMFEKIKTSIDDTKNEIKTILKEIIAELKNALKESSDNLKDSLPELSQNAIQNTPENKLLAENFTSQIPKV